MRYASHTMTSKYTRGQLVEARDPSTGRWRPAVIMEPKPYPRAKCDGAYILWTDLGPCPDSWVSTGGWQSENTLRAPGSGS